MLKFRIKKDDILSIIKGVILTCFCQILSPEVQKKSSYFKAQKVVLLSGDKNITKVI